MLKLLKNALSTREKAGNLRALPKAARAISAVDFASNDYLGLARSPNYIASLCSEWEVIRLNSNLGFTGSTGSRLLTGNSLYAEELESQIAQYHHSEAALLFNCGYMANLGLISAFGNLAARGATVFYDIAVHASVHDALRLGRFEAYPFRHNDLEHLKNRLEKKRSAIALVCIESVYSMDGSIAPLCEIAQLCIQHRAQLIVDEAHAVGVFGPEGRGYVVEKGLEGCTFARVITFGKALGSYGAAVLCSSTLKDYTRQFFSFLYLYDSLTSLSFSSNQMRLLFVASL